MSSFHSSMTILTVVVQLPKSHFLNLIELRNQKNGHRKYLHMTDNSLRSELQPIWQRRFGRNGISLVHISSLLPRLSDIVRETFPGD